MNYLNAFWVGGLICALCQVLIDKTKLTPARILVSLVVLGVILQGLGWYQAVVDYAGAGATVPLLGFRILAGERRRQSSCGERSARRVHRRRDRCGRRYCRRDRVRLSVRAAVQTAIEVVKITLPLGIHLPNGSVFAANSFFIRSRRSRSLPWRIPPQPR